MHTDDMYIGSCYLGLVDYQGSPGRAIQAQIAPAHAAIGAPEESVIAAMRLVVVEVVLPMTIRHNTLGDERFDYAGHPDRSLRDCVGVTRGKAQRRSIGVPVGRVIGGRSEGTSPVFGEPLTIRRRNGLPPVTPP